MRHRFRISILLMSLMMIVAGVAGTGAMWVHGREESSDVEIRLVEDAQFSDTGIGVVLEICFNDLSYYNEQTYLSYHIFDYEGNTVIGENERTKINLDEEQKQRISLQIDMNEAKSLVSDDNLFVTFDIVDEKNAYWFSDYEKMDFRTEKIDFHQSIMQKVIDEIRNSKLIFAINVLVFICFCVVVFALRSMNLKRES